MKKILICLIVFTMITSSVSLFIFSQTNIAQADSPTCYWKEINKGLTTWTTVSSLAIDSNNTVYAGTSEGIFKYICLTHPSAPQNLQANASASSIVLNWSTSTQGTYPITGYAIYRGTASSGESTTPLATVDANTTTYTDINLNPDTYYYIVKTFDNQTPPNHSALSNEVSATISTANPFASQNPLLIILIVLVAGLTVLVILLLRKNKTSSSSS